MKQPRKKYYYRNGFCYTLWAFVKSFFITRKTINKYLKRCTYEKHNEEKVKNWVLAELSNGNLEKLDYIRIFSLFNFTDPIVRK